VSDDVDNFKGVVNIKDGWSIKELREDNAHAVRKQFQKKNEYFGSKKQIEWMEKLLGRAEDKNIEETIRINSEGSYSFVNNDYRSRIKKRIGKVSGMSPPFTGGNLGIEFLLPQIERVKGDLYSVEDYS